MTKKRPSGIGFRKVDGTFSDALFHEEIMKGVDDTALRIASAQKAVATMGFTREMAEEVFCVKLPGAQDAS
ncbi:hypothetical protein [Azospira oryzae]|uniref:hypothetical protein n=1 Tax=Azospira oryzae TaxID=146939 RepID=UPI001964AE3C|nr:hypothetical protein [Azospira oryzae]